MSGLQCSEGIWNQTGGGGGEWGLLLFAAEMYQRAERGTVIFISLFLLSLCGGDFFRSQISLW